MLKSGPPSRILVIDSNVAIWSVLPNLQDTGVDTLNRIVDWHRENVSLVAPAIWLVEATSAIRRQIFTGNISEGVGETAVSDLFTLDIEAIEIDEALCKSALAWARLLGQSKAYDSFYLAVAHRLGAELWTADKRLLHAAQAARLAWVRWIGETGE